MLLLGLFSLNVECRRLSGSQCLGCVLLRLLVVVKEKAGPGSYDLNQIPFPYD